MFLNQGVVEIKVNIFNENISEKLTGKKEKRTQLHSIKSEKQKKCVLLKAHSKRDLKAKSINLAISVSLNQAPQALFMESKYLSTHSLSGWEVELYTCCG